MKRIFSLVLVLVLIFSLAVPSFAAGDNDTELEALNNIDYYIYWIWSDFTDMLTNLQTYQYNSLSQLVDINDFTRSIYNILDSEVTTWLSGIKSDTQNMEEYLQILSEVLADKDDQALKESQKENQETIKNSFFNSGSNLSLNADKIEKFSGLASSFTDVFNFSSYGSGSPLEQLGEGSAFASWFTEETGLDMDSTFSSGGGDSPFPDNPDPDNPDPDNPDPDNPNPDNPNPDNPDPDNPDPDNPDPEPSFPNEPTSYTLITTYTESATFTAPEDGWFQIEVFGASGDSGSSRAYFASNVGVTTRRQASGGGGGGGAYSASRVKLNKGDAIILSVGGVGSTCGANFQSSLESYNTISVSSGGNGTNASTGTNPDPGVGGSGGVASGGNYLNYNGSKGADGEKATSSSGVVGASGGAPGIDGGNIGASAPNANRTTNGSSNFSANPGSPGFIKISRGNTNVVSSTYSLRSPVVDYSTTSVTSFYARRNNILKELLFGGGNK